MLETGYILHSWADILFTPAEDVLYTNKIIHQYCGMHFK